MDEVDEQALLAFANHLATLAEDSQALMEGLIDDEQPEQVRLILAGALNYLFKSLDLIDDGIEGLGYLDDAFVLRAACAEAAQLTQLPEPLQVLAQEARLVAAFLGPLSARFHGLLSELPGAVVRGRSAEELVHNLSSREAFKGELRMWAQRYKKPTFVLDQRGLIKVRGFMAAKLPI